MNVFLDTSVVVKLYHQENGTGKLWDFLNRNSTDLVLTISDLTPIEFRSAFLRRVRSEEINYTIATQVFADFEKDVELFNIVEIDKSIKKYAIEILDKYAMTRSLRTLDALQLSSAIISNEIFFVNYFITADQKLLDIAQLYFQIYNPVDITEE